MRLKRGIIFFFLFLMIFISEGMAVFLSSGFSSSKALGNAYTSVPDGVGTIVYNPGAMGKVNKIEAEIFSSILYAGLDDGSINSFAGGLIYPFNFGVLGCSFNFLLADIYSESTFYISFGRKTFKNIYLGVGVKFFTMGISYDDFITDSSNPQYDPILAEGDISKKIINMDIGAYYKYKDINCGVAFKNLLPFFNLTSSENISEILPIKFRAGVSYEKNYIKIKLMGYTLFLLGSFDIGGEIYSSTKKSRNVYYSDTTFFRFNGSCGAIIGLRNIFSKIGFSGGYDITNNIVDIGVLYQYKLRNFICKINYIIEVPFSFEEKFLNHYIGISSKF